MLPATPLTGIPEIDDHKGPWTLRAAMEIGTRLALRDLRAKHPEGTPEPPLLRVLERVGRGA